MLAVAVLPGPARLGRGLYDGIVPLPPYQWVHPPRELARDNRAPQAGRATLDLEPAGKSPGSVATGDGQCTVIINDGALAADPAGATLGVTITPLDPASIGPPPPGFRFDGNACRFEAVYGKSRMVPRYRRTLTVVLRYASYGTTIVRAAEALGQGEPTAQPRAWAPVRTTRYAGHLHLLVADVAALGTLAPVAPATAPYVQPTPWAEYAVAAAIVLFALLVLIRRRPPTRRPAPP
ncbi:MAG TPA: hypothetical protein VKW09_09275 [bacterium]|nr:hypothetical protein [bacterium]